MGAVYGWAATAVRRGDGEAPPTTDRPASLEPIGSAQWRFQPLPLSSSPDLLFDLFDRGYHGLWGHKQVVRERFDVLAARPDLVHVVLDEVDVCRFEPDDRLIDGPGVVTDARDPSVYASLLLGACAVLCDGPADIDSWGDAPDVLAAYRELGFEVVERLEGYELTL